MDAQHLEFLHVGSLSALSAVMAPLAGVALSLLALWTSAMPTPTHVVAVHAAAPCRDPAEPLPGIRTVVVEVDNRLSWDGQALADMAALDAQMRAVGALPGDTQPEVHVEPHGPVTYGAVIAVLASAQRNGVRTMEVVGEGGFISDGRCALIDE